MGMQGKQESYMKMESIIYPELLMCSDAMYAGLDVLGTLILKSESNE